MAKQKLPDKWVMPTDTGHAREGVAGFDVGIRLVVAVIGVGGVGLLADRLLGTTPWLMLGGIVAGFTGWLVMLAKR